MFEVLSQNFLVFIADAMLLLVSLPVLLVTQYSGVFYIGILLVLAVIFFYSKRIRVTSERYVVYPKTHALGFLTIAIIVGAIAIHLYAEHITRLAPLLILLLPIVAISLSEKVELKLDEHVVDEKKHGMVFRVLFWLIILPPAAIVLLVIALSIGLYAMG